MLATEGDRAGDPLGDQDQGRSVGLVEPADTRVLEVEHADQLAAGEQRRADLAADVVVRAPVVGVLATFLDQLDLAGAHDPPDHPGGPVETFEDAVVPALRAERRAIRRRP